MLRVLGGRPAVCCFDGHVRVALNAKLGSQNVLAMLPMAAVALGAGEVATLRALAWSPAAVAVLVASCVAGLGMSYFSFALRAAISATSFSVIGNVCKVLTILVNLLMWDQHASARPPQRVCSAMIAWRMCALSESGSVQ